MRSKNKLLNLLGQIRIYSLADLIILLIALKTSNLQLLGVILLHLGFLLFLEYNHAHKYRISFPKYLWILFMMGGVIFYKSFWVISFLVFSFLYIKKTSQKLSSYSPFFRGLQYYFLAAGIIGPLNSLSFVIGILIAIRNFAGDLRDITKDKKDKMKTLPIILGFTKDIKHAHLIFLLATTFIWWYLASISPVWLIIIYLIQIGTYNLTPR